ncbi:hypothetical protein [Xenorhabdus eapokensis]|uniref:hypothetical protein n=1 Tax=Xenorhabdus eapokensis TaxID=1873482 RepID=UPI0013012C3E|nr:hypothetical protein [Xenorhabdus eapokensis]
MSIFFVVKMLMLNAMAMVDSCKGISGQGDYGLVYQDVIPPDWRVDQKNNGYNTSS